MDQKSALYQSQRDSYSKPFSHSNGKRFFHVLQSADNIFNSQVIEHCATEQLQLNTWTQQSMFMCFILILTISMKTLRKLIVSFIENVYCKGFHHDPRKLWRNRWTYFESAVWTLKLIRASTHIAQQNSF